MPCNSQAEARAEIYSMLVAGLPENHFIRFQGIDAREALATEDWSAIFLNITDGLQATLAGDTGKRHYNKIGFITIQSFGALSSRGFTKAENLATLAEACYRGKTGAGGIWFRNFRSTPVGPSDAWYQFNTTIDFEFSQYI